MKIKTQSIRDFSEGMFQAVDPSLTPLNSVYLSVNLDTRENIGRLTVRDGTTQLGSQIVSSKSCLGLYQHIESDGTKEPLAVFNDGSDTNSDIYLYSGGSWSKSKENWTAGEKVHFVTYLDVTTAVNGTDSPATYDGTDWSDTTVHDTSNFPNGKYVEEFKNRVYVAGVSGNSDRLYYSSIPSGGNISWTSGNGYIDVEPEEGAGSITGLAKVPGYLLIFKERSMKRWDTNSTYPESMITIGAPSQEAIVQTRQAVYYFNQRGIYETTGGYPRKISRRIQDIINGIDSTYYSSVSGWGDGENIYFNIGDIEIDDFTINNAVIQYHIDSQVWDCHSFPNELVMWYKYVDSNGKEFIIAGDDNGNVWKVFEGNTDGGSNISYMAQTHEYEFGSRGRIQEISRLIVYTDNVKNGIISRRENGEGSFEPIGRINKQIEDIKKTMKANYFEFRIQGKEEARSGIIGIDLPGVDIKKNVKQ